MLFLIFQVNSIKKSKKNKLPTKLYMIDKMLNVKMNLNLELMKFLKPLKLSMLLLIHQNHVLHNKLELEPTKRMLKTNYQMLEQLQVNQPEKELNTIMPMKHSNILLKLLQKLSQNVIDYQMNQMVVSKDHSYNLLIILPKWFHMLLTLDQ